MSSEQIKPGYKRTEVGVIPEEWSAPRIDQVLSEISMGPFGSDIKVSNFVSEGIPVLSGANVQNERLNDYFVNYVTPAKAKSLKKAVARRGDIVITHRGTLGQVAYIPENSAFDSYVISQSQFRARFNFQVVTPSWVALYFLSAAGSARLLDGKGHTGVPALAQPTTNFRLLHLPLPPLNEQRAIAAALSDVDALLAQIDQLIAKKRNLKQAAMQQLLTGQTRLPGFSAEWEVKRLGNILTHLGNGAIYESTSSFGLPVTRIETIADGAIDFSRVGYAVPTDELKKYRLKKGDILFSHINSIDHIGKVAIYESDTDLYHGINLLLLRPTEAVTSRYLFYWLGSTHGRKQSATLAKQAVSQASINTVELKGIEVPLPGVAEQTAIATVLTDMDAELAELEARRDKTRALKQGMMQELLTGRIRLKEVS